MSCDTNWSYACILGATSTSWRFCAIDVAIFLKNSTRCTDVVRHCTQTSPNWRVKGVRDEMSKWDLLDGAFGGDMETSRLSL